MVHQFEMYFANEYLEEIVADFAKILNLKYDEKDLEIASKSLRVHGLENVVLIQREGCLLCIDCNFKDFIYPLVVMCQDSDANKIKAAMLEWDNKIREEYYQELTEEIKDVYNVTNGSTLLSGIEKFYHISIHDEFAKNEKIIILTSDYKLV